MLAGYLIGIAIFGAVSAVLIKLAARIATTTTTTTTVTFWKGFVVSGVAILAALFTQILFEGLRAENSFVQVLPGLVFFASCWLLGVQFIGFGAIDGQKSYAKAFLVTLLQCIGLFIISIIFSILLLGIFTAAISAV